MELYYQEMAEILHDKQSQAGNAQDLLVHEISFEVTQLSIVVKGVMMEVLFQEMDVITHARQSQVMNVMGVPAHVT